MPSDLSSGIKIGTDLSSVLSQSTRVSELQTDRQTDRILIARPRLHSSSVVKTAGDIRTCFQI